MAALTEMINFRELKQNATTVEADTLVEQIYRQQQTGVKAFLAMQIAIYEQKNLHRHGRAGPKASFFQNCTLIPISLRL